MVGMTLKIWYFNKYFFILSRIPISANLSWRIKFSYILFVNNESFCIGISNTLKWPNEIITTVNKRVNILKVHDTFREASQAWPKSHDRAKIQCRFQLTKNYQIAAHPAISIIYRIYIYNAKICQITHPAPKFCQITITLKLPITPSHKLLGLPHLGYGYYHNVDRKSRILSS